MKHGHAYMGAVPVSDTNTPRTRPDTCRTRHLPCPINLCLFLKSDTRVPLVGHACPLNWTHLNTNWISFIIFKNLLRDFYVILKKFIGCQMLIISICRFVLNIILFDQPLWFNVLFFWFIIQFMDNLFMFVDTIFNIYNKF